MSIKTFISSKPTINLVKMPLKYCVRCNKPFLTVTTRNTCSKGCKGELKRKRRRYYNWKNYYRSKTNPYFYIQFFKKILVREIRAEKNRIRARLNSKAIRENYPRNKAWVYKQLGNKCQRCRIDNPVVFEIHHPNPAKKPKHWNKGKMKRTLFAKWFEHGFIPMKELENMVLLCANCHRIIESEKTEHLFN